MLQVRVSRLNSGFHFVSHLGIEVAHVRSSEQRGWIGALFTHVVLEYSFFEGLEHVDVRVLDGELQQSLGVHTGF